MCSEIVIDKKLKKDVKEVFVRKSNDITVVDDIFSDEHFQLNKYDNSVDIIKLYEELFKWKRIAQLSLNLYHNYEVYNTLEVVVKTEDNIPLNSKPNQDDIIKALYNYVFYCLTIQREERRKLLEEIFLKFPKENYKCYMCDFLLELNDLECSTCHEPVESTINKIKEYIDGVGDSASVSKNSIKKLDTSIILDDSDVDDQNLLVNRSVTNVNVIKEQKCDTFHIVPDDPNSSCMKSVSAPQGEWACGQCTAYNSNTVQKCTVCGHDRNAMEQKCRTDNGFGDVLIDELCDAWDCWYRFCMNKNYGDGKYCIHCGLARNLRESAIVRVNRYKCGKKDSIWVCSKCDLINENMKGAVCEHCGVARFLLKCNNSEDYIVIDSTVRKPVWKCVKCQVLNDGDFVTCKVCFAAKLQMWVCSKCTTENKLTSKQCISCDCMRDYYGKERISVNVVHDPSWTRTSNWRCWYKLCRKKNEGDSKFCAYCRLERFPIMFKGAPVWQIQGNTMLQKWICDRCSKINVKDNENCLSNSCQSPRTMIYKWCTNCGRGNPKRMYSFKCGACRQPFFKLF